MVGLCDILLWKYFRFFFIHLFFKIFFWDVKYVFFNRNLVIFVKSFFFQTLFITVCYVTYQNVRKIATGIFVPKRLDDTFGI
jgi:hypothetical protein